MDGRRYREACGVDWWAAVNNMKKVFVEILVCVTKNVTKSVTKIFAPVFNLRPKNKNKKRTLFPENVFHLARRLEVYYSQLTKNSMLRLASYDPPPHHPPPTV